MTEDLLHKKFEDLIRHVAEEKERYARMLLDSYFPGGATEFQRLVEEHGKSVEERVIAQTVTRVKRITAPAPVKEWKRKAKVPVEHVCDHNCEAEGGPGPPSSHEYHEREGGPGPYID